MRHRDPRHVLARAEDVAGKGSDRRGRGGARQRRRRTGALHAGVHVRLVVVADVEDVVVALEHAGQAPEADIGRAAVAALGDDANAVAAQCPVRRGDARRHRGRVAEQRVDPGNLPRGFRIGRREDFQATGGIDGDQLVVGRAHGGIDGIARAQGFPAALTRAVPGIQRIGAMHVRLHRALVFREKPVADGERAGLVELDLRIHDGSPRSVLSTGPNQCWPRPFRCGGGWPLPWVRCGATCSRVPTRS